MASDFEMVIGLEVHVQMRTKSKLFCGCSTKFGVDPNANTCPVCLGMPGVLPNLNRLAVEYGIRTGRALNCRINEKSIFARKNYFYPDLPKGYQISQYEEPLCEDGYIEIDVPNGDGKATRKRIGIQRLHLEEDAGKSMHENAAGGRASLIDLNRAGVPLMEIVTNPDLRDPEEAVEYLKELRSIVRYLGVSDGNMQEGSLRCDANVSVRPRGQKEFGTRAEVKNINSFKFVSQAIRYEARRQEAIVRDGGKVVQETRLFDAVEGVTRSMRSKEEAHDYRYFPEPDLRPLIVQSNWVERVAGELPELPLARRDRFREQYGHTGEEAATLTSDRALADYFEEVAGKSGDPRGATNWIKNELLRELHDRDLTIEHSPVSTDHLSEMLGLISEGTISGKIAKEVFSEMLDTSKSPGEIVEEKNLVQIADESSLRPVCEEIVRANPKQVEQFKSGKTNIIGFFVGQVMKKTRGKANPKMVNRILQDLLKKA